MTVETRTTSLGRAAAPLQPDLYRVVARRNETSDVTTLDIVPIDGRAPFNRPGQFNMLSAFGVGEIAISIASAPSEHSVLRHSIRDVGMVSHALCRSQVGDVIGVRGPYGTDWRIEGFSDAPVTVGRDVVIIAGGIGLAPLRGAVTELVASASSAARVYVLVGARDPSQIAFRDDLAAWERAGAHVLVTVDRADAQWRGRVGVVTTLLTDAGFDPLRASALVCGPEIMMRFSGRALLDAGVDQERILVSLERNMQCGLGWCGHCQLGPLLLCRDGPVVAYSEVVRELMM